MWVFGSFISFLCILHLYVLSRRKNPHGQIQGHNINSVNKLAKLQATLVGNYDSPTHSLTGVKCRAASLAKNKNWYCGKSVFQDHKTRHSTYSGSWGEGESLPRTSSLKSYTLYTLYSIQHQAAQQEGCIGGGLNWQQIQCIVVMRLWRWYETIPDQWWTTIKNNCYQYGCQTTKP